MTASGTPEEPEYDALHAHELTKFAWELRGRFLEGTAWVEVLLTDIIAHYFWGERERRMFFFGEVANLMTFRAKSELLEKILSYEFPELHAKFPRLKRRLERFREFRNVLAHNHTDTWVEKIAQRKSNEVGFVQYKRGKMTTILITYDEAKRRAEEANELRRDLLSIQRQLSRIVDQG